MADYTRKTPNKRSLWFDAEDLIRITDRIQPVFERAFAHFVDYDAYSNIVGRYFTPYPLKVPDLRMRLKLPASERISIEHAKNCLDYLGFDQMFKVNYIRFIKDLMEWNDTIPSWLKKNTTRLRQKMDFDSWFDYLSAMHAEKENLNPRWSPCLYPERLKEILVFDDKSKKKWEKRLQICDIGWTEVKLSKGAMMKITKNLFDDHVFDNQQRFSYTEGAIDQKIKEWKGRFPKKRTRTQ